MAITALRVYNVHSKILPGYNFKSVHFVLRCTRYTAGRGNECALEYYLTLSYVLYI